MLSGLVFDFDGLIMDTEWPEYRSIAHCFEDHGLHFPPERWVHVIGSSWNVDWVADLEAELGAPLDREALHALRRERARALREPATVLPGVRELLTEARQAGLGLAVASSSPREWVEPWLDQLGLRPFFALTRCLDDVSAAKPDPELYVSACAGLGIDPASGVALEDSANGVTAANAAGMVSVAVPNQLTRYLDLSHAHLVVDSLADIGVSHLHRLMPAR